jgi:hypothetical protein
MFLAAILGGCDSDGTQTDAGRPSTNTSAGTTIITTTTTDLRNEIKVTDDQIVSALGSCPDCEVTGRIEFDHPTWGHSVLVTLVKNDGLCSSRLAAIDQYGQARWQLPAGNGCFLDTAFSAPDESGQDLPSVDAVGHLFVRYNPGRYDGVIVLAPTPDGFDDFNSVPTGIASGSYSARFYNAYIDDTDSDDVFEIIESQNDCNPTCADGSITKVVREWNGTDYVDDGGTQVAVTDLAGNWKSYNGSLRVHSDGTLEYVVRELVYPEVDYGRIRLTLHLVAIVGNVARATVASSSHSAIPVGTTYRFSIQRPYLVSNGPDGSVFWCAATSKCED